MKLLGDERFQDNLKDPFEGRSFLIVDPDFQKYELVPVWSSARESNQMITSLVGIRSCIAVDKIWELAEPGTMLLAPCDGPKQQIGRPYPGD